jgi:AP-1-like transcription factor
LSLAPKLVEHMLIPNREKIQSCPSIQNGNIDMDDLCSQLQSKAKCSGDGPVINEKDFKEIIHNIVKKDGKPLSEDCVKTKASSISTL